jgi:hypothetical protein
MSRPIIGRSRANEVGFADLADLVGHDAGQKLQVPASARLTDWGPVKTTRLLAECADAACLRAVERLPGAGARILRRPDRAAAAPPPPRSCRGRLTRI